MLPDYSVMELESCLEKLYCCLQDPDPDPVPTPYVSVPSTPTEVFHTSITGVYILSLNFKIAPKARGVHAKNSYICPHFVLF